MLIPVVGGIVVSIMRPIHRVDSVRWEGGLGREGNDLLAVEEPLEIRLNGTAVAVTMRTPGQDFALAAGFLYTEGILKESRQIGSIARCSSPEKGSADNVVDVLTSPQAPRPEEGWQRRFYLSSSCGICGRSSIDAVRQALPPLADASCFDPEILYTLPELLRGAQQVFSETGALHAAALFTRQGELQGIMEDVGRHNAVDKIIGSRFLEDGIPLGEHVLLVSGRLSFEITQKALMAGIPALGGISGASSLAVDLARETGMLLVGFLRGRSMQVYAGSERLCGA
ncbi:MAG: formate dehydrogenase accessory sulfurtransferase FdhD [Acidobacteria bacterium]|nr:formate dehydrogenase accessory sulfurtransferase FdhD [Acidobacteriota bacterium]